jgi:hypothetical protein
MKASAAKIPAISQIANLTSCLAIGSDKKQVAEDIMERQRLASLGETEELCIHAEGGTTNGHLIQFKKGAFAALLPIRPKAVRYIYPTISPSSGVLDGIVHHVLVCGCLWSRVEVDEMPVFRPNDFFWKNHQKEGEEKW